MRMSRSRILAAAVALAFPAFVQAQAGLAPAGGSALHPAPPNPSTEGRRVDPEGLGTRIPAARTPTGLLYNVPLEAGLEEDVPEYGGWRLWAFVEAGGLRVQGDARAALFRKYMDLRDGAYLHVFAVAAERPSTAHYAEATGGAVGMRDQYYRVQGGRYNDWRVSAFFDSTPHAVTSSYRSLWSGVGGNTLVLEGLAPGGAASAAATRANVLERLDQTGEMALDTLRRKAGVRLDKNLGEHWKAFASLTSERKEGARPLGAVFGGGGGGGNLELAEPIDYQTHELLAGLRYGDAARSLNLSASASLFRNDIGTLTFQNPLAISLNGTTGLRPNAFTTGRFDLAPDNEHYRVRAEYAHALPAFFRGHFTASASLGTMRQDDALLAPTEFSLAGGTVTAGRVPLENVWNTPEALSRKSANLRVDTRMVDVALGLKPWRPLDVKAKLRYHETDGSNEYLSCNPLTGQLGRLLNDGSGIALVGAHTGSGANPAGTVAGAYDAAACDLAAVRALGLVPASGNQPIARVPNDHRQLLASVDANYRMRATTSLNARLEREHMRREYRERGETWEDRLHLAAVERGWGPGTLRVSYEHARRAGSAYHANPYEPFLSASLGPAPSGNGVAVPSWFHSVGQFRSFDLADRAQDTLNARWNHAFADTLDGALTFQHRDAEYPASYGRSGHQRSTSATLDLTWQAGASGEMYAFYSHQRATGRQAGVQPNACQTNYTYYFFSNGRVLSTLRGAPAPATPEGATLLARQDVTASNWREACGEASPTSPLFPASRTWSTQSRDRHDVLGVGVKYDLGRARLDASFTRSLGRTRIGYAYDAAALGMDELQASLAGDGFSDLVFAQNVLEASLAVPIGANFSIRMLARRESGRVRDWHYDGVAENPMPTSTSLYLDAGPRDYRATVLGVFLQVRL